MPIRTLLVDDCIDKQLEFNSSGARYSWSVVNYAGLINAIDSLAVIRAFVFEDKTYAASEVLTALCSDDEEFLSKAWNYKNSFGNGNEKTAELAKKTSADIFSLLDSRKTCIGLGFLPLAIQFSTAARAGEKVGAPPMADVREVLFASPLGQLTAKIKKVLPQCSVMYAVLTLKKLSEHLL